MNFPSLSRNFFRNWLRRKKVRPFVKKRPSIRPYLQELEDRTLMSVLPTALVSNQQTIATGGFAPNDTIDPINSQKLVEVHSTGGNLVAQYSTDGGSTWTAFPGLVGNNNAQAVVSNQNVVMDRAENIYIVDVERAANNSSGFLVFQRWRFNLASPTFVATKNVQSWTNVDPVENPVIAVDNNVQSFTDSGASSSNVQTDTMAHLILDPNNAGVNISKSLYIAWNTNNKPPTGAPATFSPNLIMVAGSGDGGVNWTSPQIVNDGGNAPAIPVGGNTPHYATPQVLFSQGSETAGVGGGQLIFAWNDFGNNTFLVDSTLPDSGVATTLPAQSKTIVGTTGAFDDAGIRVASAAVANGGTKYSLGDTLTVVNDATTVVLPATSNPLAQKATLTVTALGASSFTPANLGTGYTNASYTLTVQGGTVAPGGSAATITVATSGGAVSSITSFTPGSYSVPPSGALTTTGGGNNDATFTGVFDVVTAVSVLNPGAYIVPPANPVATTDSSGPGINATFTLSYGSPPLTPDLSATHTYTAPSPALPASFIVNDIEVTLNITAPHLDQLSIDLIQPSSGTTIHLIRDHTDSSGNPVAGQGLSGGANLTNTVFNDNAPRKITDTSFNAPYTARFTAEVGTLDSLIPVGGAGNNATISGIWTLKIVDFRNDPRSSPGPAAVESVTGWSIKFSHINTTGFGTDQTAPVGTLFDGGTPAPSDLMTGAAIAPYPTVTTASGPLGIGPNLTVAIDNTLGAFSPYQGRIYVAWTAVGGGGTNTDIYSMYGDFIGPSSSPTWSTPTKVNDDSASDGFSEGIRPQFSPTIAVDQATGTVGVMYYDARWDPSLDRPANSFSDSIDGGNTWNTSTFLNTPKTAIDMITGNNITIEPVPGNTAQADKTFGFGERQGLVMYDGNVVPVFGSNDNNASTDKDAGGNLVVNSIKTATVTIAGGPRIIYGDMGPITADFHAPVSGVTYNNAVAPDGTRELTGIAIRFDRPVLISSFGPGAVTIVYRDTVTNPSTPGVTIPNTDYQVLAEDAGATFGNLPGSSTSKLATTFLINFFNGFRQSGVGTYSYSIAPNVINDGIRPSSLSAVGNHIDENQNAVPGETSNSSTLGDAFAVPTPTVGGPFNLPYSSDTLPLIIPGPHATGTSVNFNPQSANTTDNEVLNGTNNGIDVTFDRNIQNGINSAASTFTPANVVRIEGPMGPITTYTLGPAVSFTGGGGGSGASGIATIVGGQVVAVDMINQGSGYTALPTVVFTEGPGGKGVGATGTANIVGGKITSVTITSGGAGYALTPAQAIPDNGTINVPMTITDSLQVNNLSVGLTINHNNVSDLAVTLIAPDLTQVPLIVAGSASGMNFSNTIFDDNAPTLITGTAASNAPAGPYTGIFRPAPGVIKVGVATGGSGYAVNDILNVLGGTFLAGNQAQLKVTSVSATGAVTGVSVVSGGAYKVQPFNAASVQDVTTPAASGAGINLTFGGLSALNGKNYLGTWTLRITDNVTDLTAGTLSSWSLNPVSVTANPQALSSAVIATGGSGYKAGDVLFLNSGVTPATNPAQILVTSVDGTGKITSVSVYQGGLYSVPPGSGDGVTGGSGSGATFNPSFTADGTANRTFRVSFPTQTVSGTYSVVVGQDTLGNYILDTSLNTASIANGGTSGTYAVGDTLTVSGGAGTASAQFKVTAVSGGKVTGIEMITPGSYTSNPGPNPVATTGGGGSGATLNLIFGNRVDTNLNAGVSLLFGGTQTNSGLQSKAYLSGTVNTPLPAGQTVNSFINVPDSYLVQGLTVTLTIQHQNDPDLKAFLIAPDGFSDLLFSGVGTSGSSPHANFTNTTLDDSALTPIQQAATIPVTGIGAGPWNPQLPLTTAFKGHGSFGGWVLRIVSNSATLNGTLVSWSLNIKSQAGLGSSIADQFTAPFRIFTQDPTNPVAQQSWTAVGPASIHNGGSAGRIGGLAIDPSDPSGNTVYTAGASGAVWKTTNFMTTDPNGPTWMPLTDLGPGNSLNTESIAVFGRNNDPNQSIIFVATGEGDTGTPGVGFLRSMDGGRTWRLLDSTTNVDASGNVLAIGDAGRDHIFVGTSSHKVIVDPNPEPSGDVIVYAANSSGIWRSTDTGGHWTQLKAGSGTDVVLAAGSAGSSNGNLQILYAALEGDGVYFTSNAPAAVTLIKRNGSAGNAIRRDVDVTPDTAISITGTLNVNPSGPNGVILLAAPAFTGNPLEDALYESWCYAEVVSGGLLKALYETKDFGQNWTKVRITDKQVTILGVTSHTPTNDDTIATDYSVVGSAKFAQGWYNHSLAVDPNNAAIVYMGGTSDGNPYGFIRIDTTTVADPYAVVAYDNSNNDGGLTQFKTQGPLNIKAAGGTSDATGNNLGPGQPYGMINPDTGDILGGNDILGMGAVSGPYFNMQRDPESPFLTPASLQFTNIKTFGNTGEDTHWNGFTGGGLGGTDQHELVVFKDPISGHTRLIFGDDQGVWTGTDRGDGTATSAIGSATVVAGSRNGNLQITQFYDGATQPSTLAADLAGALFYGVAQDDGWPISNANTLDTGRISWTLGSGDGDASGVKTDQTGSGSAFLYKWPCCGGSQPLATDFFTLMFPVDSEVSRTTGLILPTDDPTNGTGQWPFLGGPKFAVNPIDGTSIVMSSVGTDPGRIWLTSGPSLGAGKQWFDIGNPTDLDSSHASALAFGAPKDINAGLSDFIYAGTTSGNIFVTFTGGGAGTPWKKISNVSGGGTLSGAVQAIVTNPNRGSHEAYAVTSNAVYWMQDSSVAAPLWVNITGNLFKLSRTLFNDPAQLLDPTAAGQLLKTLESLTALQADYRYAIPDSSGVVPTIAASPTGATESGNTVTITTTAAHGFTVGQTVRITGVGVAGYNGTYTILSVPTTTTFTYSVSSVGLLGSGGGTVTPTHPVLYVGGVGGVYRSFDKGTTWTYFPDITIDGALQAGGLFPTASSLGVTDLALSLGNINPTNGTPQQQYGRNMLVATTYGRGTFAIRLDDQVTVPNGNALYTYAVNPVSGPHVSAVGGFASGSNIGGITVTFSGPVDPVTFTTADILSVTDPAGNPVPVSQVVDVTGGNPHNIYHIVFQTPESLYGFYHVSFGPNISDYSGYKMDQNQNGINGENPADVYAGRFLWQPFANHAPVLTMTSPAFGPSVNEDATAATIPGTSVNSFVTGLGWPASGLTDADHATYQSTTPPTTEPVGIAITGVDNTNGTWQYSLDNGVTWQAIVGVAPTTALLLEASSNLIASPDMLRFLPNANYSLNSTFNFRAWDLTSGLSVYGADGGTADTTVNGGSTAFSTAVGTATITVNFVNDQPSFTASNPPAVNEDVVTAQTVNGWATFLPDGNPVPALNESGQIVLAYTVSNITNASLFASGPTVDNSGNLHYTLNPNVSGTSNFDIKVQDSGGILFGGVDTSATQTFTITVNLVNDQPSFTASNPASINEDVVTAQTINGWAVFHPDGKVTPDANEAGQTVLAYTVSNVTTPGLFASGPTVDTSGNLHYTLKPNVSGTSNFDVKVQDNGGTLFGGVDTSTTQTFTLTVNFVNDQPSFTASNPPAINEDVVAAQTVNGWAVFHPDGNAVPAANEAAQTVLGYTVSGVSNAGLFASPPTVDNSGNLHYTLNPNLSGTSNFTVKVQDSGGVLLGGVDTSATQIFTLTVNFVNDRPTFTASNPPAINEDVVAAQTVTGWVTNFNPGGAPDANESSQTVLAYTVSNVTNAGLFASVPTVDASGNLHYTLKANVSGTTNFDVTVQDNGGTLFGGIDTSLAQTFTLTVNFVNDRPSFTASNPPAINEDVVAAQTVNSWAVFHPDGKVTPDANEAGQAVLAYNVSGVSNAALFASGPTVDTSGNLHYTLNPNVSGTSNFTVTVQDNGGTLFGGIDTSLPLTFTLTVNFVNDRPSFTASNPPAINEDIVAAQTVTGWVTNFNPGGAPDANEASQTVLAYTVSNVTNSGLFASGPTVDTSGNLHYTLKPNVSGTSNFDVKVRDSGGTLFGGIDTSLVQTFTLTVNLVNDQPSFTASNPPDTVKNNTTPQTVTGWATFHPDGNPVPAANEAGQTVLAYTVSGVTNAALFASGPTVDTSGNLHYTLNPNIGGTTNFTVTVRDNGGTLFGGIDTSLPQTFTLNVDFPPTITSSAATTFTVGTAGSFNVTASALEPATFSETGALPSGVTLDSTGLLHGTPAVGTGTTYNIVITATNSLGTDTQNFTLTVNEAPTITSGNNTTFTVGSLGTFNMMTSGFPASIFTETGTLPTGVTLDATGVLSGTPAVGMGGIYNIAVTATNGVSPDATQNFTLTVNEAPAITSASATTFVVGTAGSFAVTATGMPNTITFSKSGALPSGVTLSSAGVLSGTPGPGTGGTYAIVLTATNGISPNATQNFTLTVNQASAFTSVANATFTVGTLGTFNVGASGFPAPTFTKSGTLPSGVTLSTAGVLTGTPAANTGGTYNIVITASNGVGTNATQNFTLTVNQLPAFTSAASTTFSLGIAGTFTVTVTGFPAPTLSVSGTMPAGVSFNATSGVLSGTPTGTTGNFNLTFSAHNSAGTKTQAFVLTIAPALAFSPALTNKSYSHTVGTVNLSGAANKSGVTYALSITSSSPNVPGSFTASIDTGTGAITITGFSKYAGTVNFKETATLGPNSINQTFAVTFTNNAPVLNAIADQTMVHGTTKTVTLSYSDLDTPTDTLSLTFSAAPYSQLYNLQQQLNLYVAGPASNPYYLNLYKKNEKWLKSHKDGNWYALVVVSGNTNVYAFTGNPVNPFGTLKGIFTGTSLYNNPLLLVNATPPPPVNVTFSFNPTTKMLSMTPSPSNFMGQFQVTVNLSDGITSVSKMFVVTVT